MGLEWRKGEGGEEEEWVNIYVTDASHFLPMGFLFIFYLVIYLYFYFILFFLIFSLFFDPSFLTQKNE